MENDVSNGPGQAPPPPIIPANAPPLITPPPPPRPPRPGKAWMKIAIVLGILLVFSVLNNLRHMVHGVTLRAKSGRQAREHLEELTFENNQSKNKIAVLDIAGIISNEPWNRSANNLVDLISDQLRLAGEDDSAKAVVLRVDSPGGEVLASDEIYRAIADFEKDYKKPVVASMGGLAASGGYYVSAPCRWIVANELTITGSIGVIMHGYNYRGLMNKVGLRPMIYKSGRFKDMLSGERDLDKLTPEERADLDEENSMLQRMITETYDKFKSVVTNGRRTANRQNESNRDGATGRKLSDRWTELADRRVLSGKDAFDQGLVDQLGNWRIAVKTAQRLAGIDQADLVSYQIPFSLGNLLGLFGQ